MLFAPLGVCLLQMLRLEGVKGNGKGQRGGVSLRLSPPWNMNLLGFPGASLILDEVNHKTAHFIGIFAVGRVPALIEKV